MKRRSDPLGPSKAHGVVVPTLEELIVTAGKYARYGITKKTMYETSDGETHTTFAEAMKHVTSGELRTWLVAWFAARPEFFSIVQCSNISDQLTDALRRDWLVTKHPTKEASDE